MNAMSLTLSELANLVGGAVRGDAQAVIKSVAPAPAAGHGDLAFIADRKNLKAIKPSAGACYIAGEDIAGDDALKDANLIVVKNPSLAFAKALGALRPLVHPVKGIHPSASINPGAKIGKGAAVGACAVIEDGASVGEGAVLYPGVYVGKDASVGDDAVLYPGVVIRERCVVGRRVIIHPNTVIGSDGFGYAFDGSKYHKIPQTGIVRVEDDAELGACVTIDRATIGETVIGRGTKIDNLVQIAHNVKVGEDAIIVAQVGIAGSSTVGSRVQIGGQAGIVGHITIGDGAMIGAQTGVSSDVEPKTVVSGSPAIPHGDWLRAVNVFAKLPEMKKRINELEKRIKELEGRVKE